MTMFLDSSRSIKYQNKEQIMMCSEKSESAAYFCKPLRAFLHHSNSSTNDNTGYAETGPCFLQLIDSLVHY